ncbi:MAG: tetratricopeptide repeat protein [Candidatus Omnitrophota bacterium]|jgi:tetratricopeptide (TPR) repeat protein
MLKLVSLFIALVISSFCTTVIYHKTQQADINYYQGHRLFEKGKYPEAASFYKKTLFLKPSRFDALKELAYCYQWTGQQSEAIETFQKALLVKPQDYSLKKSLAESFSWQKNYNEAIALYQEIIIATGDIDAEIKLAQVYIWDSQPQKAKEILQKVIKVKPKSFLARFLLAQAYEYSNEPQKAIDILDELAKEEMPAKRKKETKQEIDDLLTQALISNKDYKRAELELIKKIKINPKDLNARISLGLVYLYSTDYKRAKDIFEGIIKENPDNLKAIVYLADIFAYTENFKDAEVLYRKVLKEKPDLEIKIKLADVLSWNAKYDEAIKLYDEILTEKEDSKLRLQKARILSWQRKYSRSLQEYRKILQIAYDKDINLEMTAKKAYWSNRVKHAISDYSDLLKDKPKNLEAAFDLSQIYSYQSMWQEAIGTYKGIIDISPNHFRAREGKDKAELISKHTSLKTAYELFRAESPSRDTNIRRQSFSNEFNQPLNPKLNLSGTYKLTFRSFADYGDILENEGKLKLTYVNNPNWLTGAYYDFIAYNKDINTIYTFGTNFNFRTFDYGVFGFSYDRERLENNSSVIVGRFYSDNFKERWDIDINKNLKLGFDYLFANYSDNNYKHEPGLDVLYYFSFEPKRFTIKYRYFYKNYKNTVTEYFSPHGFSTNSLGLEWRHYLNKEEIFFGANDLYYDIGYEASVDSTDIVGHRFSGEIGWDINKRLNLSVKATVVNSSCDVYKDTNVVAALKYYF